MDFNKFLTDPEKELKGVWVDIPGNAPNESRLRLLIARITNPNYEAMYRKLTLPFTASIQSQTLDPETHREIQCRCLSHYILLGWENLEVNGAPVEYSQAKAYELLLSSRDFMKLVFSYSIDQELFRLEVKKAVQGNS